VWCANFERFGNLERLRCLADPPITPRPDEHPTHDRFIFRANFRWKVGRADILGIGKVDATGATR
jgi:hypothetical protein